MNPDGYMICYKPAVGVLEKYAKLRNMHFGFYNDGISRVEMWLAYNDISKVPIGIRDSVSPLCTFVQHF